MTTTSPSPCGPCAAAGQPCECSESILTHDPFLSLRTKFGMLLDEGDFETLGAYPRGKAMLHNSWLHGSGVVWGLNVCEEPARRLKVTPGLAIDAIGRELHLSSDHCLSLDCWVDAAIQDDPGWLVFGTDANGCEIACADLWLTAFFDTCLAEPTEALASPCDPQRSFATMSRTFETIRLELTPTAWCEDVRTYRRVRILLGLAGPTGPNDTKGRDALRRRCAIEELPECERAAQMLAAFRELAALDASELEAYHDHDVCWSHYPERDDDVPGVLLARVRIEVARVKSCTEVRTVCIDLASRPSLLPTSVVQELTCGIAPSVLGADLRQDAGGPRLIPESVRWLDPTTVAFDFTRPLLPNSLTDDSFAVMTIDDLRGSWNSVDVRAVGVEPDGVTVVLSLFDRPTFPFVRMTALGTGNTPILGENFVPLAGVVGGPPGTQASGHDAYAILSRPLP